jgi:hypothetical protein
MFGHLEDDPSPGQDHKKRMTYLFENTLSDIQEDREKLDLERHRRQTINPNKIKMYAQKHETEDEIIEFKVKMAE